MSNEAKHTPTPWRLDIGPATPWGPEYLRAVVGPDGGTIRVKGFALSSGEDTEANSALIVRAVNSYEATQRLLGECETAIRCADEWMSCVEGHLRDGHAFKRDRGSIRTTLAAISEHRKANQ